MGDIYTLGTSKHSLNAKSYLKKPLQGFNDAGQTATSVRSELYARAFIVEKGSQRIAVIVADIWSCTKEIKQALVDLVANSVLKNKFSAKNLMVSGTHTHAGPAGITGYKLYAIAGGPLNASVIKRIAKAMFEALAAAWNSRSSGTIERVTLDVMDSEFMGGNRSTAAYDKNSKSERGRYKLPFDTEITSLVFRAGDEVPAVGKPAGRVLGVLSWLAMHCNSLGNANHALSGDIFGEASQVVESKLPQGLREPGHDPVIGFANSSCADISPRVAPLPVTAVRKKQTDKQNLTRCTNQLSTAVLRCFQARTEPGGYEPKDQEFVTGPIASKLAVKNMTTWKSGPKRTYTGAIGLSTLAGSEVDGRGPLGLKEGIRDDNMLVTERALQIALIVGTTRLSVWDVFALLGVGVLTLPVLGPAVGTAGVFVAGLGGAIAKSLKSLNADVPSATAAYVKGQLPKPVTILTNRLAADKVPVQVFRLGDVMIPAVPAEMTTMVGRRLRSQLQSEAKRKKAPVSKVLLTCYANDYASYVATREEFGAQRYEGSSTLLGPIPPMPTSIISKHLCSGLWVSKSECSQNNRLHCMQEI